jgi:hypothetical protein
LFFQQSSCSVQQQKYQIVSLMCLYKAPYLQEECISPAKSRPNDAAKDVPAGNSNGRELRTARLSVCQSRPCPAEEILAKSCSREALATFKCYILILISIQSFYT